MSIEKASHRNYLGIYLDEKLNFKMHIETVLRKVIKVKLIKLIKLKNEAYFTKKIITNNLQSAFETLY